MYRGTLSVWVLYKVQDEAQRFGAANAAVVVVLYLVFYASLYVTPYILLNIPLVNAPEEKKNASRPLRRITALWIALSFLLFHRSIFAFMRAYPSGVLWEWAAILWGIGSALVLILWWSARRNDTVDPRGPNDR